MKASSIRIFETRREAGSGQGAALRRAAAIVGFFLWVAPLASAQIPDEMAYSGRLTEGAGAAPQSAARPSTEAAAEACDDDDFLWESNVLYLHRVGGATVILRALHG